MFNCWKFIIFIDAFNNKYNNFNCILIASISFRKTRQPKLCRVVEGMLKILLQVQRQSVQNPTLPEVPALDVTQKSLFVIQNHKNKNIGFFCKSSSVMY